MAKKHSGALQSSFPHSQQMCCSFLKVTGLFAAVVSLSDQPAALTSLNNQTDTESPKCRRGGALFPRKVKDCLHNKKESVVLQ